MCEYLCKYCIFFKLCATLLRSTTLPGASAPWRNNRRSCMMNSCPSCACACVYSFIFKRRLRYHLRHHLVHTYVRSSCIRKAMYMAAMKFKKKTGASVTAARAMEVRFAVCVFLYLYASICEMTSIIFRVHVKQGSFFSRFKLFFVFLFFPVVVVLCFLHASSSSKSARARIMFARRRARSWHRGAGCRVALTPSPCTPPFRRPSWSSKARKAAG